MNEVVIAIEKLLLSRGVHRRKIKRELAGVCGITYQAVRGWFVTDDPGIRTEHLNAIAKAYGVSVDFLLDGYRPGHGESSFSGPMLKIAGEMKKTVDVEFEECTSFGRIGVNGQYVLVMKTSDFAPRFRPGDRLLIDANKHPARNDDVLICYLDGKTELAYVFEVYEDSIVVFDKANVQKTIEFSDIEYVRVVAAILGSAVLDVSGLQRKLVA